MSAVLGQRAEPPRSRQSLRPTLCLWAIRVTLLTRSPPRTVQSLTRQERVPEAREAEGT